MGRSVSTLPRALGVVYFEWPERNVLDENGNETDELEYEDSSWVIEDITENTMSEYPEFDHASRWEGENHIIMDGYGCEISLSEYCGLAALCIRVSELSDEFDDEDMEEIRQWIDANWAKISKPYNKLRKVGTFSSGEAIFEKCL